MGLFSLPCSFPECLPPLLSLFPPPPLLPPSPPPHMSCLCLLGHLWGQRGQREQVRCLQRRGEAALWTNCHKPAWWVLGLMPVKAEQPDLSGEMLISAVTRGPFGLAAGVLTLLCSGLKWTLWGVHSSLYLFFSPGVWYLSYMSARPHTWPTLCADLSCMFSPLSATQNLESEVRGSEDGPSLLINGAMRLFCVCFPFPSFLLDQNYK